MKLGGVKGGTGRWKIVEHLAVGKGVTKITNGPRVKDLGSHIQSTYSGHNDGSIRHLLSLSVFARRAEECYDLFTICSGRVFRSRLLWIRTVHITSVSLEGDIRVVEIDLGLN